MRELIGYLVACRGAGQAAVPMAVGVPQQFRWKNDRADRVHATIDHESIGAAMKSAISHTFREYPDDLASTMDACDMMVSAPRIAPKLTHSAQTGTPITIIYAVRNSRAMPPKRSQTQFPTLACPIELQNCQATGRGARRM
jgi:hypothetical protein